MQMDAVYRGGAGNADKGVDFSHMPCVYWSNTTKASYLQRRIIVYSIMYYENDESCVSDRYYDNVSHQLVRLMAESTQEEMERTRYWYAMHDFDGSTGFDIPSRLTPEDRIHLQHIARVVHKSWKEHGKGAIYK